MVDVGVMVLTLIVSRDLLPSQALARERVLEIARQVYQSYGFSPIETPALEYLEILTGKGSDETDKQLYRFTDHGNREVGMRFDLTVPFARFAAQHISTLGTPFKRYHMGTVWRGENTQRGRYREFMQCDFDTIGTTSANYELGDLAGQSKVGKNGVEAVSELVKGLSEVGIGDDHITLDPSIARGLDYYTGIVLESFLDDLPSLGSVCSGGRYDNLAELYTKQFLPGVGASLGIDRLLAGLEELGRLEAVETPAAIFLVYFDESHRGDYLRIAATLRQHGISVDLYPEPKKLGQQLKWAGKKGFQKALVLGSDEFKAGTAQLKDLATQQSANLSWKGDYAVLANLIQSELQNKSDG
jgi:histidyl-tRNA synthetase